VYSSVNSKLGKVAPYLLLILASAGLVGTYNAKQRASGAAAVRDSIAAHAIDSLQKVSRQRDTLYTADTVVKWRTVVRAETLLDTLLLSDTVTLTVRESVLVFAADSAIQACRSIVLSCEARVAVRDEFIAAISADRDQWRRRASPSLYQQGGTVLRTVAAWELLRLILRDR
jgi:hypothetical protein